MAFERGHALLIGIGSGAQAPYPLAPLLERDVFALAAALTSSTACNYPVGQVHVLSGPAATRAAVLAALDGLAALAPQDTLILYVACYAERSSDGNYYLAMFDTQWDSGELKSGSAVRADELIERLRSVPARRLLLIINACAPRRAPSGIEDDGADAKNQSAEVLPGAPLPVPVAHAVLATGEGRIIINACREGQVSYLGCGELTPFAHTLLDALYGRTTYPRANAISAFDLYEALYEGLRKWQLRLVSQSSLERYGVQEPELTVLKQRASYPVAPWRGASPATGEFAENPPAGLPVHEVEERQSQRALRVLLASEGVRISAEPQASPDAATNSQDSTTAEHGIGVTFGPGSTFGDLTFGDIAGRDIISTTYTGPTFSVTGITNIVAGDQHNIHTAAYLETSHDNTQPALGEVLRQADVLFEGDQAHNEEMKTLVEELNRALERAPAELTSAAAVVATFVQQILAELAKSQPNRLVTQALADGLLNSARSFAGTDDSVVRLVTAIVGAIMV